MRSNCAKGKSEIQGTGIGNSNIVTFKSLTLSLHFSYCQLVSIYEGLKTLHSGSHFEVNHLLTMVTQKSVFFSFHLPFGDLHSLPFGLSHPTFCRHAFKATLCGKRASSESSSLVTIETLKLSYIVPTFSFVKCFLEHSKIYCVFILIPYNCHFFYTDTIFVRIKFTPKNADFSR